MKTTGIVSNDCIVSNDRPLPIKLVGGIPASALPATGDFDSLITSDLSTTGEISVADGANKRMGVATLTGGTVTVGNTTVTANSRIFLTPQSDSLNSDSLCISARIPGTSFTITSDSILDDRTVAWLMVEPA